MKDITYEEVSRDYSRCLVCGKLVKNIRRFNHLKRCRPFVVARERQKKRTGETILRKFPHINQYRDVVRCVQRRHDYKFKDSGGVAVYAHTEPYPTMEMRGTVKLDGTNAAIGARESGRELYYQSREREITLGDDNYGFVSFMQDVINKHPVKEILFADEASKIYFGEWVGVGIQGRTGISKLPRRFVIFGVDIESKGEFNRTVEVPLTDLYSHESVEKLNACGIWFIEQFVTYHVLVDFNRPEIALEALNKYTAEVEASCPAASYFGHSGEIGEGIVWKSVEASQEPDLWFKTKGSKHEGSSGRKPAVVIEPEVLASIKDFVSFAATTSRMLQALGSVQVNGSSTMKDIGAFLAWLGKDIARECAMELEASSLTMKQVNRSITAKAVAWYKENYLCANGEWK